MTIFKFRLILKMREIEFGLWANEQTLFAPIFMIVGAIISVVGD